MARSSADYVAPAFERMKEQLFRPFRLGQWIRYAIVGLLAGEMGGTGGYNTRFPFRSTSPSAPRISWPSFFPGAGILLALIIAVLVVVGLILAIAMLYVSSRMRFVLFDSVVAGQCRVRQFWSQRGEPAFQYFIWQILMMFAGLIAVILLIAIPAVMAFRLGWFADPRGHIVPLVLAGVLIVLAFLASIFLLVVIHVLTKDFVVPQMALENISAFEGWRRLWGMMGEGGFAGYIGMKILLSIAAAIILGIVTVIVMMIVLVPVGGLGVIAVLVGKSRGLTWTLPTIVLAIVVGIVVLAALLVLVSLISVPAIVFFPAYSILFFADRYPALHAVLNPTPPALEPL